jgi:hypothetical protein
LTEDKRRGERILIVDLNRISSGAAISLPVKRALLAEWETRVIARADKRRRGQRPGRAVAVV